MENFNVIKPKNMRETREEYARQELKRLYMDRGKEKLAMEFDKPLAVMSRAAYEIFQNFIRELEDFVYCDHDE